MIKWITVEPKMAKGKPITGIPALQLEFRALATACQFLEKECTWARKVGNVNYYVDCLLDYEQAAHECTAIEKLLRESIGR